MKGYIQVYTGNGKGKTTAALGLALRAAGAGMKVFIAQFVKGGEFSEFKSIRKLGDSITIKQFGSGAFIYKEPEKEDIYQAVKGLQEVRDVIKSGEYDMVILDEANIAVHLKLFSIRDLLDVLDSKPYHEEIIITGRYADQKLIDRADLVTEMREVKHYFKLGIKARPGIEK